MEEEWVGKEIHFENELCSFIVIFFNYDISSSQIDESIAKHKQNFENVALTIWDHAELGYLESKSSDLLKTTLQNNGFSVTNNVANIPTSFSLQNTATMVLL